MHILFASASLDGPEPWDAVLLRDGGAPASEVTDLGGDAVAHAGRRAHGRLALESVEHLDRESQTQ